MDDKLDISREERIEELVDSIRTLISEVQVVRLENNLSKLTQVRLVDLQYSAKLALDLLESEAEPEEELKQA